MMEVLIVIGAVLIGLTIIFFTQKEAKKQSKRIDEVWANYRANYIAILEHERREKQELNQKLSRIENLLHHFIEQKAARVSDEVDALLTGGFEIQRGTPFQKEQRAAGNAVSAGLPSGVLTPKFQVGEHVQVIGSNVAFIVGAVIWNERLGYYSYSDGKDVSTVTIEPLLTIFEGS